MSTLSRSNLKLFALGTLAWLVVAYLVGTFVLYQVLSADWVENWPTWQLWIVRVYLGTVVLFFLGIVLGVVISWRYRISKKK